VKPYYQHAGITIYNGDCREVAAWLTADVLVTDPPYGTESVGWDVSYGRGQSRRHGRTATPGVIANDADGSTRDAALELWGSQRPALVFGSPRRPDPPGAWADRLVWDKTRLGMNAGPWRYRHESIFVSEGFVRVSDAASSVMSFFPSEQDLHIHAKPIGLMLQLVGAAPAGTIADPFAGSGSTLVAAKELGRQAIGVELDERYCEIAARRLSQEVLFPAKESA
jgi:DNA modification methylase